MVLVCLPVVCTTAGMNSFCGRLLFSLPLCKPAGLMLAQRPWGFLLEWAYRTGALSQEFHRMFEASLLLGYSKARLDAKELALGVWPLPLVRESLVRGHSPVLWEACAGCRGLLSPFCRASCQGK